MKFKVALSLLTLCFLTGCRVGPTHCIPKMPVSENWDNSPAEEKGLDPDPERPLLSMENLFNDPLLCTYLRNLVTDNLDVQLARAKVGEAFALRRIAYSRLFPSIDQRIRYNRSFPAGGVLTGDQNPLAGDAPVPLEGIPLNLKQQTFLADFDALWEVDLFGKNQRRVESACAFLQMEVEAERWTMVTVLAEFIRVYLDLRRTQKLVLLAQEELTLLEERADLLERRFKQGLDSEASFLTIRAQEDVLRTQLNTLEANARASLYSLSVIAGRPPTALKEALYTFCFLPEMREKIPVGLPSDLLRRRPDIRRAERQIAQATAEVGVAVADLFPRLTLDGSYGFQNLHLGRMKGEGESWSYGVGLLTPVFHGGRLRATVNQYQWRRKQSFIEYEKTVLHALEEAESALVRLIKAKSGADYLKEALNRQKDLFSLQERLYKNGLSDKLHLYEARQRVIQSERAWVDQETESGIQLVALYKALGGPWDKECFN